MRVTGSCEKVGSLNAVSKDETFSHFEPYLKSLVTLGDRMFIAMRLNSIRSSAPFIVIRRE